MAIHENPLSFYYPHYIRPTSKINTLQGKKTSFIYSDKAHFFIFVFKLDTNIQIIYNEYIKFNNVIAE